MREEVNSEPTATPPFHQRFNIQVGREDLEKRFVNRILNRIGDEFPRLRYGVSLSSRDEKALLNVANRLGKEHEHDWGFREYVRNDFYSCLQGIEALFETFTSGGYSSSDVNEIDGIVQEAITLSEGDLGIRWVNGVFRPSGAKLLDEALVNDNLKWLSDRKYTNVLTPFSKGLDHFLEAHRRPERLADTITDMYEALEALAKVVTDRDRDLSANAELFVSKLKLSNYYKKMLKDYILYACEYRHAVDQDRQRVPPIPQEVEAFIYTTGLFIRLAIESLATT